MQKYYLWFRFLIWIKFKLWRGKKCHERGKRCKAMYCNISDGNCYEAYARRKAANSKA